MLIPKFEMEKAEWDRYKRFHTYGGSRYKARWVQFENGELYFLYAATLKDARQEYLQCGISIVSTADTDFKFATPDEPTKEIPHAHLNQAGQQIFVVDHGHRIAVALGTSQGVGAERMRGAQGYCRGDKEKPVGGRSVFVHGLASKEQRAELNDVRNACCAWWELEKGANPDLTLREQYGRNRWKQYKFTTDGSRGDCVYRPHALYQGKVKPFADLTRLQRAVIAEHGYSNKTDRVLHTYPFVHILT